jgi:hypothetical protein
MKKALHLQTRTFAQVTILVAALLITGFIFSCNNSSPEKRLAKEPAVGESWVVLNIKFRPGATAAIRDTCIMRVKDLLIDSVKSLRKQYPNYYPAISVEDFPFIDSLSYVVKVAKPSTTRKGGIRYAHDTSTNIPVSCTCSNGCKICFNVPEFHYYPTSGFNKNLSVYIESVTTEEPR